MTTIRLQAIGEYLYATDASSAKELEDTFKVGRIPCDKFWMYSPKVVSIGYKMAITGEIENIKY